MSDWVVLDTETTGVNRGRADQAVEIAVISHDGAVLFDSLIRPTNAITTWENAAAIHGITHEDVADAPTFAQVWPELYAVIAGKLIYAYNAPFDQKIIENCLIAAGQLIPALRYECVMRLTTPHKGARWVSLATAANVRGIEVSDTPHRALSDAALTRRVLLSTFGETRAL
jgi:DNA polymerase-3 subunit epsilon